MDQKPSKDLAPRELLGNVYTAQNEMETWHLPEDQAMLITEKKKNDGGWGAIACSFCGLKDQNSSQSSRIFLVWICC